MVVLVWICLLITQLHCSFAHANTVLWIYDAVYVPQFLCNKPACFHDPHDIWLLLVVTAISLLYHSMHLRPSVFLLHCYFRTCWKKKGLSLWVLLSLIYFFWWALRASYCISSLLPFISFLLIWGSQSLIGLLNSIVAGLCSPEFGCWTYLQMS